MCNGCKKVENPWSRLFIYISICAFPDECSLDPMISGGGWVHHLTSALYIHIHTQILGVTTAKNNTKNKLKTRVIIRFRPGVPKVVNIDPCGGDR